MRTSDLTSVRSTSLSPSTPPQYNPNNASTTEASLGRYAPACELETNQLDSEQPIEPTHQSSTSLTRNIWKLFTISEPPKSLA